MQQRALESCTVGRQSQPTVLRKTRLRASYGYGYGYGFKLGLHRSPTSLPLVYLRRRAPLALGRASMFGGVNLLSSRRRVHQTKT